MMNPTLRDLQAWLATVMLAPGEVESAIAFAKARSGLGAEEVIAAPPRGASRAARLAIYANGYVMRLIECLRAEHPALQALMGEGLFDFFARAYLLAHPSRSPTLFDLGKGFADFLEGTQASRGRADPALRLPIDVARVERALSEASRAPGLEHREAAAIDPLAWLAGSAAPHLASLSTPPCLRLLALSHPVKPLVEALRRGDSDVATPAPAPSFLAVTRVRYRVSLVALDPWQYAFVAAAPTEGVLGAARESARQSGRPLDAILGDLILWLPVMIDAGVLAAGPSAGEGGGLRAR